MCSKLEANSLRAGEAFFSQYFGLLSGILNVHIILFVLYVAVVADWSNPGSGGPKMMESSSDISQKQDISNLGDNQSEMYDSSNVGVCIAISISCVVYSAVVQFFTNSIEI
jgi:hypothetical protein